MLRILLGAAIATYVLMQSEAFAESKDVFVVEERGFGVEREMKESGEKGGTEDINIVVGELQECTESKSMDTVSPKCASKVNREFKIGMPPS